MDPTDIVTRRSRLTPAKQALLKQRLQFGARAPVKKEGICRRLVQSPVPLSFAQERLWILSQLEPDSSAYNIPANVAFKGKLNLSALEQSLNEVVRRHEILRTTFSILKGKPVQVIARAQKQALPCVDLSGLLEGQGKAEAWRLAEQEAARSFSLADGPLIRAGLLRLREDEHIFLFTMHHIITDGWSTEILTREVSVLYGAYASGEPSPLAEPLLQYADYAIWQREWLKGEILDSQLGYWKRQLLDSPMILELPTDRPRGAAAGIQGDVEEVVLSEELSVKLNELSRREGATLFMVLLAAFKVLLCRYTGQEDVSVGTPIANRNRIELEGLPGLVANTQVMRTGLFGEPTFLELLGQVRETALSAYAHQDLPFEKLVDELQPERSLNRTPLFQVMIVVQNAPKRRSQIVGLEWIPIAVKKRAPKFDLTLTLTEQEGKIGGQLEYDSYLFGRETIKRIIKHYERLLEAVVERPEERITRLPLLTVREQHQLLTEWNDTWSDHPVERCLSELFEEQAGRTPDAVAVICENEKITYRELNARANQMAHYLAASGVGPEVLVGTCLDRSVEFLIAMLGILKTGGAYLPLDPSYPRERLLFMLENARAQVLITRRSFKNALPERGIRVVCLESEFESIATENQEDRVNPACGDNLAYVIYTSGSTGRPKGVMIEQSSMINHIFAKIRSSQLTETDRLAQTASQCFDSSVWQFLAPLLVGATAYIFDETVTHDPEAMLDLIERGGVTILSTVPSMLKAMLDVIKVKGESRWGLPTLRCLIEMGEALPANLCIRWMKLYPDIQMVNAYGLTECSDDVTHHVLTQSPDQEQARVPIGGPLDNTRFYVLDRTFELAPAGIIGELYVGGIAVGRGYINDPRQTAERFLPDPYSGKKGARLYKSGDLVRHLSGGELDFLGRADRQTKFKGFRIECEEIEGALTQHPAVRDSVVLIRADRLGNKRLVAYVVCNTTYNFVTAQGSGKPISESHSATDLMSARNVPAEQGGEVRDVFEQSLLPQLRRHLLERLPEYMLPTSYVVLETLPLTLNGKVDRNKLPEPDSRGTKLEHTFLAPRTQVETVLTRIWEEVLDLERISVDDNFFRLGGDSIISIQITARANQVGLKLTPKQLFENPTVEGLARVAGARQEQQREQELEGIEMEAGGYSPGDFPEVKLSQYELDDLIAELG